MAELLDLAQRTQDAEVGLHAVVAVVVLLLRASPREWVIGPATRIL
jgi:hypothetical protein